MGLILSNTDFTGKYELPTNNLTKPKIDLYIAKYEENYLRYLFGVEFFDLFKASFSSGLPTAPYLVLYNPIYPTDDHCGLRISEGIKEMLRGFLYWEIARDGKTKQTMSGPMVNNSELGANADFLVADINKRYNDSIQYYDVIQWYIEKEKTDILYETYKGRSKKILLPW